MIEFTDNEGGAEVGGTHYEKQGLQPIEFIDANKMGFDEGNVVKYISRHKDKNGYEDILKCIHYAMLTAKRDYGLKDDSIKKVMNILKESGYA